MFPLADVTPKLSGRDYKFREPTLRREPTVRSEYLFSRGLHGEPGESQPTGIHRWRWSQCRFFGRSKVTPSIVITMNSIRLYVPKQETFPIPLEYIDVTRFYWYRCGCVTRKADGRLLESMIASALKKLLNTQIHFRKRVSVEEQRAQKHDRFLRGRWMRTWSMSIPWHQSLWSSTRTLRLVSKKFTECRRRRFRRRMGSCTTICWWNTLRYDPERIVQVKIKRKNTPNFRLCWLWMIKKRL